MLTERRLSIPGPAEYRDAMVLAFLAGRKTQVRLPVKSEPPSSAYTLRWYDESPVYSQGCGAGWYWGDGWATDGPVPCPFGMPGPFGAPGDVLWIPETWGVTPLRMRSAPAQECDGIIYFATDDLLPEMKRFIGDRRPWNHMPRRACRLTRRVVDVRIEQVQAISGEDAVAEGVEFECGACVSSDVGYNPDLCIARAGERCGPFDASAVASFRDSWNTRYAGTPFAWDENPMVWVGTLEPEGA